MSHKLVGVIPLIPTISLLGKYYYFPYKGTETQRGIPRSGNYLGKGWDLNFSGIILINNLNHDANVLK